MKTSIKIGVSMLVLVLIIGVWYATNNIVLGQVIQLPNTSMTCKTFSDCSAILTQQGFTYEQIASYLTVCDSSGCHLLP